MTKSGLQYSRRMTLVLIYVKLRGKNPLVIKVVRIVIDPMFLHIN